MFNLKKFVYLALKEDTGKKDYTSWAIIEKNKLSDAVLLVKEECILAGLQVFYDIFKILDPNCIIELYYTDGQYCKGNKQIAAKVTTNTRILLQAERLVLNILQRMSAIATKTSKYVEAVKDTKAKILDTRKTTPLFRYFEKLAVTIGGGYNHRYGLYDMILIKDNHISCAGSIEIAMKKALDYINRKKLNIPIEIEARSLNDVETIIKIGGVNRIMLDNFSVEDTKKAVDLINGKYEVESSGGINLNNVRHYAMCGVDYISVGDLTHTIKAIDISLKVIN
ncbi:MAG: carboxylating nicotinate-nucleotide diphosphorylase [Bacteroidales bacterium]|nr:carboxylating nicotinate-nucleotide diphosphorylase [Bacteroidales bacterium]